MHYVTLFSIVITCGCTPVETLDFSARAVLVCYGLIEINVQSIHVTGQGPSHTHQLTHTGGILQRLVVYTVH